MNFKAITRALANTQQGMWLSSFRAKKPFIFIRGSKWIKLTGSWETAQGKDGRAWPGNWKNHQPATRHWGRGDAGGCKWLTFRSTAWIRLQWAITPNSMACVRAHGWEGWDSNPGTSTQLGISMALELAGLERNLGEKWSFSRPMWFFKPWKQPH